MSVVAVQEKSLEDLLKDKQTSPPKFSPRSCPKPESLLRYLHLLRMKRRGPPNQGTIKTVLYFSGGSSAKGYGMQFKLSNMYTGDSFEGFCRSTKMQANRDAMMGQLKVKLGSTGASANKFYEECRIPKPSDDQESVAFVPLQKYPLMITDDQRLECCREAIKCLEYATPNSWQCCAVWPVTPPGSLATREERALRMIDDRIFELCWENEVGYTKFYDRVKAGGSISDEVHGEVNCDNSFFHCPVDDPTKLDPPMTKDDMKSRFRGIVSPGEQTGDGIPAYFCTRLDASVDEFELIGKDGKKKGAQTTLMVTETNPLWEAQQKKLAALPDNVRASVLADPDFVLEPRDAPPVTVDAKDVEKKFAVLALNEGRGKTAASIRLSEVYCWCGIVSRKAGAKIKVKCRAKKVVRANTEVFPPITDFQPHLNFVDGYAIKIRTDNSKSDAILEAASRKAALLAVTPPPIVETAKTVDQKDVMAELRKTTEDTNKGECPTATVIKSNTADEVESGNDDDGEDTEDALPKRISKKK